MPNAPAARITDQVKHTEAMNLRRAGGLLGGLLGAAAGCLLVGAALATEVVTAGMATPLVAVAVYVGAGLVIGGSAAVAASAFSNQGAHIGQNIPGVDEGPIVTGIPTIHIGSERHVAAYLGSKVLCNRHKHSLPDSVEFVAQGSRSVRLGTGRFPAARIGDKGTCDCKIGHGCDTVIIGGETITVGSIDLSGDDPEAAFFNKLGEVGGVAFLVGTALLAIPAGLAAGGVWGAVRAAAWAGLKFEATSKVIGGVINQLPEGPLRDTANSLATILPIFHGGEKAGGEEPGGAPSEAPTGEGTGTEGTGTEGTGTEGGTDAAAARGGVGETGNGSGLPAPSEAPAGAGTKGTGSEGTGSEGTGSEGNPTHPIGDSPGGLRGGEETGSGEESKTDGTDGKEETPPEETEPPEDKIYRKDRVPDSPDGRKPGSRKSYIDENGDLQPANSEGRASVQQHVRGSEPAKSDSPYTSFSDQLGTSKDYGGDLITLDRGRLSQDIADGKVDGVDILNHEDVLAAHDGYIADAQARYDANPTPKNLERLERAQQDRANSVRDREVLVKGTVPGEYVTRAPGDPPADSPADIPPPDSGGTPPDSGGGSEPPTNGGGTDGADPPPNESGNSGGGSEGGGSEGGGSEGGTPPTDAADGRPAGDPLVQFGERPGGMPGEAPPEQAGGSGGTGDDADGAAAGDGDPTMQSGDNPGGRVEDGKQEAAKSDWPPQPPSKPKPGFDDPRAAEWRYQRYLYDQFKANKGPDDVLPFDEWKAKHFDAAKAGGRPGRRGGSDQVRTKEYLTQNEGVQEVENVELGGHFPDGVKDNAQGGKDYFEVGKMLKKGLPESRESAKLAEELNALDPNDTMTFVDKMDPTNRINYKPGDTVDKTVEDSNREVSNKSGQDQEDEDQ